MRYLKGFTLIELTISITLLSIVVIGTLIAIWTATGRSGDPMIYHQAAAIADSYLAEIVAKNFPTTAPGACPAPPASRANYANVCDYQGLNQVPTNELGTPIAGLGNYNVQVAIANSGASLGSPAVPSGSVVRIDVTITNARLPTMVFSAYRTKY
jgi:prepilin-type N-terminal cleavage/methylation domain-containing protein